MTIDTDHLDQLADTDLGSLLTAAYGEQSRRSALAQSVTQVTKIAQEYVDAGGDKASLVTAIQDLTPQAEQSAS